MFCKSELNCSFVVFSVRPSRLPNLYIFAQKMSILTLFLESGLFRFDYFISNTAVDGYGHLVIKVDFFDCVSAGVSAHTRLKQQIIIHKHVFLPFLPNVQCSNREIVTRGLKFE